MSKEAIKLAASVLKGSQEYKRGHTIFVEAVEELEEALVDQPAPVQQCMDHGECFGGKCIYPAPQPAQQQPVAWTLTEELEKRETTTRAHLWFSDPVNCMWTPLYTSPPAQRKPLTTTEVIGMAEAHGIDGDDWYWYVVGLVDAQEKHNIKEQP